VKYYKFDLANNLHKLIECFNCIFIKQYETFLTTENEKEKYLETQLVQMKEQKDK